jgi:sigma-B regulation protein RsbU (phosphoserine phosphatase)
MLHLHVLDGQGSRSTTVETAPFSIGRGSDNHLQLKDARVSRRHAEVIRVADEWRIRDCGSRLGTVVNDARIEESRLKPGDRIRIGEAEIRVTDGALISGSFDFRQMNALLAGLRALGSSKVLEEVLALVLDSALDMTGAERGFVLLAGPDGKLALAVSRARGGISIPSAQTSQRIPDEVFASGEDRIVTDLLEDPKATLHAGTVALGIRHVLCTPLKVVDYGGDGENRRIGVLYLDSRERGYLQHIDALHALANEAAVVIENARLYREVVEKERAAQELQLAARIQRALLPQATFSCRLAELGAVMIPCRSVGGDFYEHVAFEDGGLAFAVGDVAGKGTSAALLTAVVQGLLAAEAETIDEPGQVLYRINRTLCRRSVESKFVTAFYGRITPTGLLRYCNAGHNPPFLLNAAGMQRLEAGGAVMGIFDRGSYETAEIQLATGDLIVLFSDGVTEAESPGGDEFGDDRLAACLALARDRSPVDVVVAVQEHLREFCGATPPSDDVTLLAVRVGSID